MKRVEWFWSLLWCVAVSSQPRGQPIVVISLSLLIIDYHLLSFPQFPPPFFFSLPTLSHRHQFKQRRDNPLRHFIECVFVQASKRRRIRKTTAYECVAVFGQTDEKDYWDLCANTLNGSTWMLVQNTRKKENKRKVLLFSLDQCLHTFFSPNTLPIHNNFFAQILWSWMFNGNT